MSMMRLFKNETVVNQLDSLFEWFFFSGFFSGFLPSLSGFDGFLLAEPPRRLRRCQLVMARDMTKSHAIVNQVV